VLLSKFAKVKKGDVVADFCSGSGIVGIHLYALNPVIKSVTLFEMQEPLYNLSIKSIKENGLEKVINAVNCKLQDISSDYNEQFSLITVNPPYMKEGTGDKEEKECISVCKREKTLTLAELVKALSKFLKYGGRANIVHRADRLAEVIYELKNVGLEPKRLQFVKSGKKEPYLFLLEAVKGGKAGLTILKDAEN
jgi:tRNA1(Val) A37 N6-methylase TrmN6